MQEICLEEKQKKGPFWILLITERTGLADGLDVEGEGVKGVNLQIFGWIK